MTAGSFGVALVVGRPFESVALSGIVYMSVAMASGIVMVAAARVAHGRSRFAWTLVGAGFLSWGIGEMVWMLQSSSGGEIPYPGVADLFYVVGYPLIFTGVIALPYLRQGRFERIRLSIDATAGAISLAVVMWVAYLHEVVVPGADPVETLLNVGYPFGDVLLMSALMVLAMRRSEQRLDLRIVLLAAAIGLTAIADVIFALENSAGTYVEWGRLDSLWLFGYGLIALTAGVVTRPPASREATYQSLRSWQLIAPYTAVAALFLIRLTTSTGNDLLLNVATTAVAVLVVVRQNLAVRETGELLARQRDDLVASVSHEMRTPLTGIQGYAQILSQSWDTLTDEERQEMLAIIEAQAGHLGHIVTDLIDVARDRLQNLELVRGDYSAADIVREAVAAIGNRPGIETDADVEARVWAEPDRVRQVLTNLITNAVRYGRSRVIVTAAPEGRFVVFAVHDDGDGVPPKYQSDIWERFERGAHNHDTSNQGSGIGLSIARDLVTAHGGTIAYRPSDLLGGGCFEFTIPIPEADTGHLVTASGSQTG